MSVATFQQGRQRCVSVCVHVHVCLCVCMCMCVCVCVNVWTDIYLNFFGIIHVCASGWMLLAHIMLTASTSVSVGATIPSVLTQIVDLNKV